jgi:rhodanese-related sulfurtransferase
MKRLIIIVAVVLVGFGGLIWLSKTNDTKDVKGVSTQESAFQAIQQDVKNGAKLYDVRLASEYSTGHFEGAVNWSLQDMQAGKLPNVPKDTKVYVYCHSGNRSGQATTILRTAGYTNVTDLHGLTNVESLGGKLVTN